jgi:Transglutaminase-like superfamily
MEALTDAPPLVKSAGLGDVHSIRDPPMRTLFRSAVFVSWAVVMAVLATSSLSPRAPASAPRPLPAEASEKWYGVYSEGRKVGYQHRVRKPSADGFTVESETQTQLSMLGTSQLVSTRLVAETDRALRPRKFDFQLRAGGVDFAVSGLARGEDLEITSTSLGRRTLHVPASATIALSQTLEDLLGQERVESGKTFRYTMFDPVSSAPAPVTLTIGALEDVQLPDAARSAYRVDEEFQGAHFRLWIEPNGAVVKEEGPLGLTLLREADARAATGGIERGASVDLAVRAAIPVARAIDSPRALRRLRLRVSDVPESLQLAFPPRQRLEAGALVIEREEGIATGSVSLPVLDPSLAEDLRPTPFMQVDDPKVRELAAAIVGGDRDAATATHKLLDWVFANLAKEATVSVPNAVEVLETRKGDCNEHAVLFAALARAAGLPARMVAGTVYAPADDGSPGAFYYHAWNLVWLGRWVAVDPTFGQFPADATHVALVEGGPDKDIALVGVIGRIRFEVESFG